MNKVTPRGASASGRKKRDVKEAQRRLFNASSDNNNTKKSAIPLDNYDTKAPVALLDNNNTEATVSLVDDDDSVFNSNSMATVSQVDNIDISSLINPSSAAMSPVFEQVLGGYELQPINPSDSLDVSTGDWVAWCDKDQVALQSVPEENEGDEEVPVKVTTLVRLIVDLSLDLKIFTPFPISEATSFEPNLYIQCISFELNFYLQKQLFRA